MSTTEKTPASNDDQVKKGTKRSAEDLKEDAKANEKMMKLMEGENGEEELDEEEEDLSEEEELDDETKIVGLDGEEIDIDEEEEDDGEDEEECDIEEEDAQ